MLFLGNGLVVGDFRVNLVISKYSGRRTVFQMESQTSFVHIKGLKLQCYINVVTFLSRKKATMCLKLIVAELGELEAARKQVAIG